MANQMTVFLPAVTGLRTQYFGTSGGSTTRFYWVQAIYTAGKSLLAGAPSVTALANMDNNNRCLVEWNPMAYAIGYNVFYTTTSTPPTGAALATAFLATVTKASFSDQGISSTGSLGFVIPDGFRVFRGRYEFAIDGDPLAPGLITLANSDVVPKGTILVGGLCYTPTNFAGATNVIVGLSAGGSNASIHASATIATYNGLIVPAVPTFAVPVRVTADGTMTITSTVAALTAGIMDIFLFGVIPVANP